MANSSRMWSLGFLLPGECVQWECLEWQILAGCWRARQVTWQEIRQVSKENLLSRQHSVGRFIESQMFPWNVLLLTNRHFLMEKHAVRTFLTSLTSNCCSEESPACNWGGYDSVSDTTYQVASPTSSACPHFIFLQKIKQLPAIVNYFIDEPVSISLWLDDNWMMDEQGEMP